MPTVLVVDDDRELREALAESLAAAGYQAIQASNGRQALERLAAVIPDAILVDVMMPIMNGVELLRVLRADAALKHIPVILMTGVNDSMIGVRLNAPVVTKPNFDALLPILRQYVRRGGASAESHPADATTRTPFTTYAG
jgi:two-component system, OmpR family, response regulator MprA